MTQFILEKPFDALIIKMLIALNIKRKGENEDEKTANETCVNTENVHWTDFVQEELRMLSLQMSQVILDMKVNLYQKSMKMVRSQATQNI